MTYKVKLATLQDVDWIVKDAGYRMLHEEVKKPELYNVETIRGLVIKGISEHTVLIAYRNDKRIGVLGAVLVPHYLNHNQFTLAEIMWWVEPEYRNGRAGLLLLKAFSEMAKRRASKAILSLLGTSPVSDETLARYGFKLTERNYMLEN